MLAMLLLVQPLLVQDAAAVPPPAPPCTARQLSLSVDGRDGQFDGMQKSGTELSIRNRGADCTLPALPRIEMLDRRGRMLAIVRAVPVGMHPGPVMIPVRLGRGHRAATDLTWITGRSICATPRSRWRSFACGSATGLCGCRWPRR